MISLIIRLFSITQLHVFDNDSEMMSFQFNHNSAEISGTILFKFNMHKPCRQLTLSRISAHDAAIIAGHGPPIEETAIREQSYDSTA